MSPDKYLIILYNRTRPSPFRVLSVTCQLIKTGLYSSFFPLLYQISSLKASFRIESICRWYYTIKKDNDSWWLKKKQRQFKDFVKIQRSKIVLKCLMSINHAAKICWTILFYSMSPLVRRRVGGTYSTGIVGNGINIIL